MLEKLETLGLENLQLRTLYYEVLVDRTRELAEPLAENLGVQTDDAETGLQGIRKSSKNWRVQRSAADRNWITGFFDADSVRRWPLFLDRTRNLLD